MNARQAANVDRWAVEDAAGTCGLCGGVVGIVWNGDEGVAFDLCHLCNGAVQDLADRLGRQLEARDAGPAVVQVPGQLELEEDEGPLYVVDLDAVRNCLWTGEWAGTSTTHIAQAVLHHGEEFSSEDLRALRLELERRA